MNQDLWRVIRYLTDSFPSQSEIFCNKCGKALGGNPLSDDRWTSGQLLQQRLGLLQVFRIKPFGEPAVDLG